MQCADTRLSACSVRLEPLGGTRVVGRELTRAEGAAVQACLSKSSKVSYSVVPAAPCK